LVERLPEFMVPGVFVGLEALPLTPNGKLDRGALPAPEVVRPQLEAAYVAPVTPVEQALAGIWAEVLGLERVGVHDNFFELGGDSILSIQIVARAAAGGLRLTPRQLFEHQTVAQLAAVAGSAPAVVAEQGVVTGAVPLTPIQRWFFEQDLADPHHFNQAALFEVGSELDGSLLGGVLSALLAHHDALRLRFQRGPEGWVQAHGPSEEPPALAEVELGGLSPAQERALVVREAAACQASLDLARGPLVRGLLFRRGPGRPSLLLLVVHHLVVDGVSWRILAEDLQGAYQRLAAGEAIALPAKTTAFRDWAVRLAEHAASPELARELPLWLSLAGGEAEAVLPLDRRAGPNDVASAKTVTRVLGRAQTRALLEAPARYRAGIDELLLAALVQALAPWTGREALLLDLEGHGREELFPDLDLSRTVGWFTTLFPLLLRCRPGAGAGERVRAVKESLRAVPARGIGFGLLRYGSPDPGVRAALAALPAPRLAFNYLGQFGAKHPGQAAPDPGLSGPPRSPRALRRHLLEINASVVSGQLHVDWTYSENHHQRATLERLADGFLDALDVLVRATETAQELAYSPSDFPEARISDRELAGLVRKLATGHEGKAGSS